MSWLSQVAIGAVTVLTVVGSIVYLARKGLFEPDSTNEQSQEEREELSQSVGSQDFEVPFRKRVSAWSGPYKMLVASVVLLVLGSIVAAYQVMKTGSPVQQYATSEVRYAAVGVIGIGGGVWLKGWFDSQVGKLAVVYERAGQRNVVELIEYAKTGVRRRDGKVTVPEIESNRLLGLFWRYRQVGEDRRLRGTEKPLSDVITHLIPDHGDEMPDGEGWVVETKEEGDKVLTGATTTGDVTYRSPNTLSDEQATQNREKMKRKDAELDAVKSTNAELYTQVRKMRKKIENEEYQDRTDLMEDFDQFSQMLRTMTVELKEETDSDGPLENGENAEASA